MSTSVGPKAIVKPKAPKIKPTIFREYIGVKPYLDNLPDFPDNLPNSPVINPNIPEFHYILGFATENYDDNGRGTGHFTPKWNVNHFSPEHVENLKQKHENVRVLISIGGLGIQNRFHPTETEGWVRHAIDSLTEILKSFKGSIDGIDINYEVIKSNCIHFANCIWRVISALKDDELIEVVSIAPSEEVQPHYMTLFSEHGNDIDWVNYKFYNHTVPSADEFINLYQKLSSTVCYHPAKLLAGFSTDPDVNRVTLEVFLKACIRLLKNKALPGIFFWNANDSYVSDNYFGLERNAQILLVNPPP